ncbi:MAG: A/G-specific adenine glycosylase [Thermoanaerobaculia bacterium]
MPSGLNRSRAMQSMDRRRAAAIARKLEAWFAVEQRPLPWRDTYDPYHVWLVEVMAQQTRLDVVLPYFARFVDRFPDVRALAAASEEEVLALWSGLGYYRRARMLRAAAIDICRRFGGAIPRDHDALLGIDGIGRYTAGAIASIAYDDRQPVVDGNVARLLARMRRIEHPLGSGALAREEWAIAALLVEAAKSPRALNQAMMELGARICRPRHPECGNCPVARYCDSAHMDDAASFPRAAAKAKSESVVIPLFIVANERGAILMRREQGSTLNGMFALPHGDGTLTSSPARSFSGGQIFGSFRHTVTSRRIKFQVCEGQVSEGLAENEGDYEWVHPSQLATLPHPSWVRKAIEVWRGKKFGV